MFLSLGSPVLVTLRRSARYPYVDEALIQYSGCVTHYAYGYADPFFVYVRDIDDARGVVVLAQRGKKRFCAFSVCHVIPVQSLDAYCFRRLPPNDPHVLQYACRVLDPPERRRFLRATHVHQPVRPLTAPPTSKLPSLKR